MRNQLRLLFTAFTTIFCFTLFAQRSIPANSIVTENFNSIGTSATATLPSGWRMSPSGSNIGAWSAGVNTTTQAASSGLPTTGGRYNWATTGGTDRAVGFLTTSSYRSENALMAHFINNTGSTLNSVTISFSIERYVIHNGSFDLEFESSTDGSTWTPQPNGTITSGFFPTGAESSTFSDPKTITKTATINITIPNNGYFYFRWVFNTSNGNSQGWGIDDVALFGGAPTPVLTAKLKDILQVDGGTAGQFNTGDVIRYETKIKNIGSGDAENVQISIPPPSNTTLVPSSIKTSAVAVDDNYATGFNTVLNGTTVLTNDFGTPLPTAVLTFGTTANGATYNAGVAGVSNAGAAVTVNANGTFTYTPLSGFTGIDYFTYITGNGNLPNNDAVVTVTVYPDITFATTHVNPTCNGGSNGSITFNASGGAGSYTYSITGAAGTYVSSNSFTGLAAGTYNVAVKDAIGTIKTNTVTLTDPAVLVVSGTIPDLTYNTVMSTATFTKTGGTGTVSWSATGLPAGITINSSTGAVTGTPSVTGAFDVVVTTTDANGCTGTKNISFNVKPKVQDDSYASVTGNTQLVADAHSTPATPYTTSAVNILANDVSDAAMTVSAGTFSTINNGSITIGTDGKFTYTPPLGAVTTDSYTYTVTSNGVSATGTINLTIAGKVWYVDNTYAGVNGTADGRSHRPFTTLDAAASAAAASQYIYVHTGSGNTTGNGVLKANQILRGAGSTLTVGALSIPASTRPTLSGTIILANSVTADGFDMNTGTTTAITSSSATGVSVTINSITTNGAANAVTLTGTTGTVTISGGTQTNSTGATFNISGGSVNLTYSGGITQSANAAMVSVAGGHTGTLSFNTGTLSATNGTGLQFDNADGTYNFNGTTTLNGGDAGIDILNGSGGTFSFNANTAITNPTGIAININASAANVTYTGTFSKINNAITGISITNNTGGTIALNGTGTKTLSTQTGNAINITSNTGTTINFSGNSLLLTTTSGVGFNATGGGTISVAGSGNTITSPTGTALNVANTTISATGLTFQSISSASSAATIGIILNNTGSAGGLTVTGDGTNTTKGGNGTGGTIANKTGADGSTTQGIGIYLNNTANVTLRRMQINDNQNLGIFGTSVTNFKLEYSTINGTNGTTSASTDAPLAFGISNPSGSNGLFGTLNVITSCKFSGGIEHNLEFYNQSGSFTLNISNSDINDNSIASGSDGILMEMQGTANATVTVQTSTFTNNKSQAFQAAANDNSIINLTAASNTVTRGTQGNEGFVFSNGSNGQLNATVSNNNISGFGGASIFVGQTPGNATAASNLIANINGNIINAPATATNHALIVYLSSTISPTVQTSNATITIANNNVTQNSTGGTSRAIIIDEPDVSSSTNFCATVTGNTVIVTDNVNTTLPIVLQKRRSGVGTFDVRNNTAQFPNGNPMSISGLRVRQASPGTVQLEQGASGSTDPLTVLGVNNPGATREVSGVITVVSNATCN